MNLDHFQCQKTAVEQLKERFETMKLSYDAYRFLFIIVDNFKLIDFVSVRLNMLVFKLQETKHRILVKSKQQLQRHLIIIIDVLEDVYQSFLKH